MDGWKTTAPPFEMTPFSGGHVSFFLGRVYFLNLCPPLHNICAYSIFPFTLQLWLPLIGICRSTLHLRKKKTEGRLEKWCCCPVKFRFCLRLPWLNPDWTWIKMTSTFGFIQLFIIFSHLFGNLTVALRRSSFCKPSTARCVSLGGKTSSVQKTTVRGFGLTWAADSNGVPSCKTSQ